MLPGKRFVNRIALSWWMKVRVLNNTPGYRRSSVLEDFLAPSLIWCYNHRLFIHSSFFWWLNPHFRLLLILKQSKTIIFHCLLMLKASFLMIHLEFQGCNKPTRGSFEQGYDDWGPKTRSVLQRTQMCIYNYIYIIYIIIYNYIYIFIYIIIYIYRYYIHRYSIYLVAHPTTRK